MRAILVMILGLSGLYGSESVIMGNLQWQDNADAKTVIRDWDGANSYCANLTLEGYRDWRLPSIKELQSLVDRKKRDPAIKGGFRNTAMGDFAWYWSASPSVNDDSVAWVVDFNLGATSSYTKTDKYYVRCVRGRQ